MTDAFSTEGCGNPAEDPWRKMLAYPRSATEGLPTVIPSKPHCDIVAVVTLIPLDALTPEDGLAVDTFILVLSRN